MRRIGAMGLVVAVSLGACGVEKQPPGTSTGTGGSSSGGAAGPGSGGATATGGNGGASVGPLGDTSLDESFPWFLLVHPEKTPTVVPAQEDGAGGHFVHVAVPNPPASYTISTHHHVEIISFSHTITFSARVTEPSPLQVSLRRSLDGADYIAAAVAGTPWPSVTVQAGTAWQHFEVPIADLSPSEGDPATIPRPIGFMLAFAVEKPGAVQLDLDDVHIK